MVCKCTDAKCTACMCGKAGTFCTKECHQGKDWELTECMNNEFGMKVKTMKPKDVRTALIANTLSPVGDVGELRKRLADCLRKKTVGNIEVCADESTTCAKGKGVVDDKKRMDKSALFNAIIENEGDNVFILSLSGKEVSMSSGKSELRRAYLLISASVHPDKHQGSKEAVKAFQIVLSAYEYLANPPKTEDEKSAAKRQKTERFTRSNNGCFKTKVLCPQCKQLWGEAALGLEDCAYNFFMMAVKKYICGRCCCEFGCMTALHFCPHCRKACDYDPDDYHKKIKCGNDRCTKEFGFWMFKVSERREKEVRLEVKKQFEEERKRLAQKQRRGARANKRVVNDDGNRNHLQERLFVIGLRDSCPRCGWELSRGEGSTEATEHLEGCNDSLAWKEYQKKLAKQKEKDDSKAHSLDNQVEVMELKRWEMNGRQVGQLWMLCNNNIKRQCEQLKLDTNGKRHELISRISQYLRSLSMLMITDGKTKMDIPATASLYDTCSIGEVDEEDLPENIEQLDREELQDLCASYNVKFDPKKDAKVNLVKQFLSTRSKQMGQMMICDKTEDVKTSDDDTDSEEYVVE